jgi:WD40 repeat protein
VQRSDARTQARRAHGRELASRAQAEIPVNPQISVGLALRAAKLAPGQDTANVLRSSIAAMRETGVLRLGGNIVAAAFAPQGDHLLVASSDGRLGLYDRAGHQVENLPRQLPLTVAAWSPSGDFFATGAEDGTVAVWRVGSTKPVRTISTPSAVVALSFDRKTLLAASGTHARLVDLSTGGVKTIVFSGGILAAELDPNGQVFAVANRLAKGTSASLVDAGTGRVIRRLPEDGIRSFAFSPDGRLLATGSYDKTARIWVARTGKLRRVLQHQGYVLAERFSTDGRTLVTSSEDGAAYVWNVANGQRELLLVGAGGAIDAAAFSPDGTEIATASVDRLARIYYAQDGRLLAPLAGHAGFVTSIGFDPSGETIVTAGSDGSARLWDALPPGTLQTIYRSRQPVGAFFAGEDRVIVTGRRLVVLGAAGKHLGGYTAPAPILGAAAHGDEFALADGRAGAFLIRSAGPFHVEGSSDAVAFTPQGMLLTAGANGVIQGWNLEAIPKLGLVAHAGGKVLAISVGHDRFLVRLATQVRIYADDGRLLSTIETPAGHATLSPDGTTLATTRGKIAQLWDADTGRLLHTLTGHRSLVTDAEFSPNSHELVTVSDDHDGRIWSVEGGRLIHLLRAHFLPVRTGSYSPDGHWIVTASLFTAGLWDAATGQFLFYLGRDTRPLTGATFSRSGNWILTGSEDGTARVYHCLICQTLPGLEATARARLKALK